MLDKNGNEIKVGDTVRFYFHDATYKEGEVSSVLPNSYLVKEWNDFWYSCPEYVLIIKSAEQPKQQTTSLSQLKAQAKLEIESLIKKHTSIINQAGGNLGMHVGFHDVRTIGSEQPNQLVDVVVTVTI